MSTATPNVAASVRARLLNVAKAQGVDFNQVLVRFALERILYRLTQSPHADRFLLKGALLFTLWYDMPHRATRDADLLGFGASDLESVAQVFRESRQANSGGSVFCALPPLPAASGAGLERWKGWSDLSVPGVWSGAGRGKRRCGVGPG